MLSSSVCSFHGLAHYDEYCKISCGGDRKACTNNVVFAKCVNIEISQLHKGLEKLRVDTID